MFEREEKDYTLEVYPGAEGFHYRLYYTDQITVDSGKCEELFSVKNDWTAAFQDGLRTMRIQIAISQNEVI